MDSGDGWIKGGKNRKSKLTKEQRSERKKWRNKQKREGRKKLDVYTIRDARTRRMEE